MSDAEFDSKTPPSEPTEAWKEKKDLQELKDMSEKDYESGSGSSSTPSSFKLKTMLFALFAFVFGLLAVLAIWNISLTVAWKENEIKMNNLEKNYSEYRISHDQKTLLLEQEVRKLANMSKLPFEHANDFQLQLDTVYSVLHEMNISLRDQLATNKEEIRMNITSLEAGIGQIRLNIANVSDFIDHLQLSRDDHRDQLDLINSTLSSISSELTNLDIRLHGLNLSVLTHEEDITALFSTFSTLSTQVSDVRAMISSLSSDQQQSLMELSRRIDNIEAEHTASRVSNLEHRIIQLEAVVASGSVKMYPKLMLLSFIPFVPSILLKFSAC